MCYALRYLATGCIVSLIKDVGHTRLTLPTDGCDTLSRYQYHSILTINIASKLDAYSIFFEFEHSKNVHYVKGIH